MACDYIEAGAPPALLQAADWLDDYLVMGPGHRRVRGDDLMDGPIEAATGPLGEAFEYHRYRHGGGPAMCWAKTQQREVVGRALRPWALAVTQHPRCGDIQRWRLTHIIQDIDGPLGPAIAGCAELGALPERAIVCPVTGGAQLQFALDRPYGGRTGDGAAVAEARRLLSDALGSDPNHVNMRAGYTTWGGMHWSVEAESGAPRLDPAMLLDMMDVIRGLRRDRIESGELRAFPGGRPAQRADVAEVYRPGQRNSAMFHHVRRIAYRQVRMHHDLAAMSEWAAAECLRFGRGRCAPALPDAECLAMAASIARYCVANAGALPREGFSARQAARARIRGAQARAAAAGKYRRAVRLMLDGATQAQAAAAVGVRPRQLRRWRDWFDGDDA